MVDELYMSCDCNCILLTVAALFTSSAFVAILDFQSGKQGKVHSLLLCLCRSPELPVGIHRSGPCLASQSVEGGAGLWGCGRFH